MDLEETAVETGKVVIQMVLDGVVRAEVDKIEHRYNQVINICWWMFLQINVDLSLEKV